MLHLSTSQSFPFLSVLPVTDPHSLLLCIPPLYVKSWWPARAFSFDKRPAVKARKLRFYGDVLSVPNSV